MAYMMNLISVFGDTIPRINEFISKIRSYPQTAIFSMARIVILTFALYFYFEKFLNLTINNIIQLTDGFSSFDNPEDYSLNHMTLSVGGLILLSFILARNEYRNIFITYSYIHFQLLE
jgi:hypothetical protein